MNRRTCQKFLKNGKTRMAIHLNGTRTSTILPATEARLALEKKENPELLFVIIYIHSVFNYFYSFFFSGGPWDMAKNGIGLSTPFREILQLTNMFVFPLVQGDRALYNNFQDFTFIVEELFIGIHSKFIQKITKKTRQSYVNFFNLII